MLCSHLYIEQAPSKVRGCPQVRWMVQSLNLGQDSPSSGQCVGPAGGAGVRVLTAWLSSGQRAAGPGRNMHLSSQKGWNRVAGNSFCIEKRGSLMQRPSCAGAGGGTSACGNRSPPRPPPIHTHGPGTCRMVLTEMGGDCSFPVSLHLPPELLTLR